MKETSLPKSRKPESTHYLKKIAFFECLSDKELSELKQFLIEKPFSKNKVILLEEDTPNYMYFIYTGKVKAVQISEQGKEQILAIHKQGEFFGEMALLDMKTSPATVIAMEDSYVALIAKKDFDKFILGKEKVLRHIISLMCSRLREAWIRIKVLSFADAEQRVRAVLKLLGEQNGIKDSRGTLITLKLTHKDIAGYASVSRETVTRLLDRFLKNKELEILEDKNILLKPSFTEKPVIL